MATGFNESGKPGGRFSECSTNRMLSPATKRLPDALPVAAEVLLAEVESRAAGVAEVPLELHEKEIAGISSARRYGLMI